MTYSSIHPRSIKWWVDQKKEWISLNHTFVFVILVWSYFKRPHIHMCDSIGKYHDQYDRWSWWLGVDRIMKDSKRLNLDTTFVFVRSRCFMNISLEAKMNDFKNDFSHVSMTKNELLVHSRLLSCVICQLYQVTDPFRFVCRSSVKFFQSRGYNFWSMKYHRNIVKTFVTMISPIVILAKPVRGKSLVKMNFVIIFVFEIHWKIDKIISLCHLKTIVFCHDHYVLDIVRR